MLNETERELARLAQKVAGVGASHSNRKAFVDAMLIEHRTHQQSFTRLCVAWLEALAPTEHYDLRNEASVNLAKAFVDLLTERQRSLPMV